MNIVTKTLEIGAIRKNGFIPLVKSLQSEVMNNPDLDDYPNIMELKISTFAKAAQPKLFKKKKKKGSYLSVSIKIKDDQDMEVLGIILYIHLEGKNIIVTDYIRESSISDIILETKSLKRVSETVLKQFLAYICPEVV